MANKYPFKLNGYIYSKGTKAGFNRMKKMGIPRPLFRVEDKLSRILKEHYKELSKQLLKDIKEEVAKFNITLDCSPILTKDGIEDDTEEFINFLEAFKESIKKGDMAGVANLLKDKWTKNSITEAKAEEIKSKINKPFKDEQKDYLVRLQNDADGKTQSIIRSFGIDKKQLFNDNMENLRKLYIDDSIERIKGEEDYIKRAIIQRIIDYATGKSDTLRFGDLMDIANKKGDVMAHLFARDQMQRFNKAITLSTFVNAKVTKIKWVTCHDVRVRKTHKELDGKIFNINDLPKEIDDYNCRCGLVPVEWADD